MTRERYSGGDAGDVSGKQKLLLRSGGSAHNRPWPVAVAQSIGVIVILFGAALLLNVLQLASRILRWTCVIRVPTDIRFNNYMLGVWLRIAIWVVNVPCRTKVSIAPYSESNANRTSKASTGGDQEAQWSGNHLFVSNHVSYLDIMLLFVFLTHHHSLRNHDLRNTNIRTPQDAAQPCHMRFYAKNAVRYYPCVWAVNFFSGFVLLKRDFTRDLPVIMRHLSVLSSCFKQYAIPFYLSIFPEGTRFTRQKALQGKEFASAHGVKGMWENVLVPRARGVHVAVQKLGFQDKCLDGVIVLRFEYQTGVRDLISLLGGRNPNAVRICPKRYSWTEYVRILKNKEHALEHSRNSSSSDKMNEDGVSEEVVKDWLLDEFREMDSALSNRTLSPLSESLDLDCRQKAD
eukprot:ANDGO_06295.mRNA.1 putative 1-acyl-sn-glycerol-3-phosphate acyltransferase 4